jgi:hypothetical protein
MTRLCFYISNMVVSHGFDNSGDYYGVNDQLVKLEEACNRQGNVLLVVAC